MDAVYTLAVCLKELTPLQKCVEYAPDLTNITTRYLGSDTITRMQWRRSRALVCRKGGLGPDVSSYEGQIINGMLDAL